MAQDKFSRREVERAFRKFNDLTGDLMSAKFQTWSHSFSHLIAHCDENPVMRVITEPLRENRNVDVSKWYADALASMKGMVGSGEYALPTDDDDRTALLYQFFLKIEKESINISTFCVTVYGVTAYQEMVYHFNQELVTKFTREVSYRLNEIMEDIGEAKEIPREAMLVFHYQDHSMNIHGNVYGSNLAAGGSQISESSASYNSVADLAEAMKGLKVLIHEVAAGQREGVENALGILLKATEDSTVSATQVVDAATTVANASPKTKAWLVDVMGKVAAGIAGSVVVLGIKQAIGIP